MGNNRFHRHFKGFGKLIFIKGETVLLYARTVCFFNDKIGFAGVFNNTSVFNFNNTIGKCGNLFIVRHDNDGVTFTVQLLQNCHNGFAAFAV